MPTEAITFKFFNKSFMPNSIKCLRNVTKYKTCMFFLFLRFTDIVVNFDELVDSSMIRLETRLELIE